MQFKNKIAGVSINHIFSIADINFLIFLAKNIGCGNLEKLVENGSSLNLIFQKKNN